MTFFRFSQEKFIRKKSKKYYPYIMVRRPSIRILAHIYYTNDPMKVMNMRIDTVAQMLNMANVRAGAKYMVSCLAFDKLKRLLVVIGSLRTSNKNWLILSLWVSIQFQLDTKEPKLH